MNINAVWI